MSDGQSLLLGTEEAGDEPVLLAQTLKDIPLLVGKDRRLSGQLAVDRFAPDVIVLDDALQFRQLQRDLDIALLDARYPFDNGFLLPRGLLREPASHLKKAGIVVFTRSDRAAPDQLEASKAQAGYHAPDAAQFTAAHAPVGWVDTTGVILPLDGLKNRRVSPLLRELPMASLSPKLWKAWASRLSIGGSLATIITTPKGKSSPFPAFPMWTLP